MSLRLPLRLASFSAVVLFVACGDDADDTTGAGGSTTTTTATTASGTAGGDTGGGGSAGVGGGAGVGGSGGEAPFVAPTPFAIPLSVAGGDQLQSVTAGPAGSFLAAGFAATAVGGPRAVTVVKFSTSGLDVAFGTAGIATTPVLFVGGSDEIDIATQSDGKILVSATVANLTDPNDRDILVLRLNADGSTDGTFGTAGVTQVNLNDGVDPGSGIVGRDSARSLAVGASDEIYVHAVSRALGMATGGGPRLDTDFTVVKLSAGGVVDTNYGTGGQFRLDIQEVDATAKGIAALAGGVVIASGYANTPDIGSTQVVLYKLTALGALDTGFATGGLFHEAILAMQTEIYDFAIHGSQLVTAGYGRNTGTTNDYVSLRFDVTNGARDLTWGGTLNGAVVIDPSGSMLGSNARDAVGLPGGETVLLGSTGPSNMATQQAVFMVLDANGALDTSYGTGIHVMPLGVDGNDQFWGGAVSGDQVALVGYQGGGMTQTATLNDDAYGVIFDIQ